jgi:hypothetical protein
MDRRSLLFRWPAAVIALTLLFVGAIGCKSLMETVAIVFDGGDTKPEFDELKGKKVVVVCKPLTSQEFSNSGAAKALAQGIGDRLKAHVKDIKIVDSAKVDKLMDEQGIDDYRVIGRKLKAEKVVAVDIESFSVVDGPTLYRGRSRFSISIYDVADKSVDWRKSPPQVEYPRTGSIPMADLQESDFRNKFVSLLADQIAQLFYQHDLHDDYGGDADSIH